MTKKRKYGIVLSEPESKIKSSKKNIKFGLFPYIDDIKKIVELKIDSESLSLITKRETSSQITRIIEDMLLEHNLKMNDVIITDSTAGVGGNALSFGLSCKYVHAIEVNKLRCAYLRNNFKTYQLTNFDIICDDCTKSLFAITNHDVIFIDPPWGGKTYKQFTNLRLYLSSIEIEKICNDLFDKSLMKCVPKIVALKLPTNYDMEYFYDKIKGKIIHVYQLRRMLFITIQL